MSVGPARHRYIQLVSRVSRPEGRSQVFLPEAPGFVPRVSQRVPKLREKERERKREKDPMGHTEDKRTLSVIATPPGLPLLPAIGKKPSSPRHVRATKGPLQFGFHSSLPRAPLPDRYARPRGRFHDFLTFSLPQRPPLIS